MANSEKQSKEITILIIDDERTVGEGVADLLDTYDYHTYYKASAEQGLIFLQSHPETDIVLLDLNLGEGLNGIEALPQIKEVSPHVQVIMLTSQNDLETGLKSMKSGAFDYLTKPFDEESFFEKVPGALERKQLSQLSELYLNILVHDLKNPLQNISMAVNSIEVFGKDNLNEKQSKAVTNAYIGIRQINNMINNILNVAKFEKGSLKGRIAPFDLKPIIENQLQMFIIRESSLDRPILMQFNGLDDAVVHNDVEFFSQVLWNLVSNATRFTSAKHSIKIDISRYSDDAFKISVSNKGSYIEEDQREKIFKKFSQIDMQTASTGQNFGLGLTYCQLAVNAMGGHIWVESQQGDVPETVFSFTVRNYHSS